MASAKSASTAHDCSPDLGLLLTKVLLTLDVFDHLKLSMPKI